MEFSRKVVVFCVAGALALAVAGCGNDVTYASQKDLNDKKYATVGLDYQDVEDAAKTAVASMLQSSDFQQLQGKKVIQVADVINDTMQHFDTEQLTQMVLQTLKDKVQDKFYVTRVAGSQSNQDKTIEQSRKLRDNAEFNQETTQEKGTLRAPDLSLSGKVIQRNARVSSSKQRIDYIFILRLVSIKSGLELWSREFPITKLGSNKAVSW
ncbi:Lipoprotein / penicillin-binding protein activator LpoB [Helicobacter sp. NHP19-003]|uniref:Penicillin-binding protein activator LpoB n=1 Tax=Helicobacter gastrocanis TaxID=2849641 RepID=A0ABN6HZ94_9HELI|nr:penicillin-binding protein activator LpoB [Helicobacter sp. NHP19-003]BCZ16755.1 Lipoprotein / penicillin-binding protein activator LpoB [Helicobacter sp. NHP19-003]